MSAVDNFGNHWKAVPYSAAALVSGDAFLILFHLMRKSRGFMCNEPIKISYYHIASLIGKTRNAVKNYINELVNLNLVFVSEKASGKTASFTINWNEIKSIHDVSSKISDDGIVFLRNKCRTKPPTSFTSLPKDTCVKITQVYKTRSKNDLVGNDTRSKNDLVGNDTRSKNDLVGNDTRSKNDLVGNDTRSKNDLVGNDTRSKNDLVGDNNDTTWSFFEQVNDAKDATCAEIEQVEEEYKETCAKIKQVMKEIDEKLIELRKNLPKDPNLVKYLDENISMLSSQPGHFLTWSDDKLGQKMTWSYNSIKENIKKEQCGFAANIGGKESRQTEISSAKASEKRVFLEFRNLELPKMTYTEFQSIINDPKFNNTETDRLIQYVWKEIEPEENDEDELEERSKDDIIPVSLFNKILFEAWSELKEELPDFSLTEEDAKNIFGFEVVDMGEEFGYKIDSSFIRNIHQLSEYEEMRREKADNLQFSRMENRMAREFFVESLIEIADKDINQLTDMEYAVIRLDDFVSEREKNKMPRFDEITAIQMGDLIEDTAREAKVSEIALKRLCRVFKKKPNSPVARIRISALDFEAVFAYNREVGQESVVEELLNKKLADYRSSTASENEHN